MRYMIIVKATASSEAGAKPTEALFARMAAYHEALSRAGILVDASGLQATSRGWRVEVNGENRSIVDGPFAETKELIAGYTIIRVKSEQQARDWTAMFPNADSRPARHTLTLPANAPNHVTCDFVAVIG